MALSGLEIYKLLPGSSKDPAEKAHANCKECGYPTCLAFAMKLAAKQAELSSCKYVSEEAKAKLSAAAAPPIRLDHPVRGRSRGEGRQRDGALPPREDVLQSRRACSCGSRTTCPPRRSTALARSVADYKVDYVGMALRLDGLAVDCVSGDAATFAAAVAAVRAAATIPVILVSEDPAVIEAGAGQGERRHPAALRGDCGQLGSDGRRSPRPRRPRWWSAPRPCLRWPS